jgi:hypothetical protein
MFVLMYLNTYLWGHIFFSETRLYMAILMGATMAVIMLAYMLSMYQNTKANIAIFGGAILVFAASLWLVRGQFTVQDRSYMRAMIPHHSIAIMTSTRAEITDPRVRGLADDIIYAQDKEIAEMRYLIADIGANGEASATPTGTPVQVVDAQQALQTEVVSKIDPEFLTEDEIAAVFPNGGDCRFAYTSDSPAVLVTSGDLVRLDAQGENAFSQGPLSAEIVETDGDLTDLIVSAEPTTKPGSVVNSPAPDKEESICPGTQTVNPRSFIAWSCRAMSAPTV